VETPGPFFLAGLVNSACVTYFLSPLEMADRLAASQGWRKHVIRAGEFDLTGFSRLSGTRTDELVVYLEGDGQAWLSRSQQSLDPTPTDPDVLALAVRHPPGDVLYLARPCQYTGGRPARGCHPRYWAGHRYAPEVVASIGTAIDQVKASTGARRLVLIGYSGGGVIAALLAARRNDVAELVTIAANLDHGYWTRLGRLTPLRGSLNPADDTARLQEIRQTHFVGSGDDVVSPRVVDAYVRRMTDRSRTRVVVLKGFDHDCCWVDNWPGLLSRR
jgi:hypothetical protein